MFVLLCGVCVASGTVSRGLNCPTVAARECYAAVCNAFYVVVVPVKVIWEMLNLVLMVFKLIYYLIFINPPYLLIWE